HPGRVKRGVAPGERLGPVLRAGHAYRLEIDGSLQSAAGVGLGRSHEHRFRVVAADRTAPEAARIRVTPPRAAGDALEVDLPEALDEALLERLVWVEDAAGAALEGDVRV